VNYLYQFRDRFAFSSALLVLFLLFVLPHQQLGRTRSTKQIEIRIIDVPPSSPESTEKPSQPKPEPPVPATPPKTVVTPPAPKPVPRVQIAPPKQAPVEPALKARPPHPAPTPDAQPSAAVNSATPQSLPQTESATSAQTPLNPAPTPPAPQLRSSSDTSSNREAADIGNPEENYVNAIRNDVQRRKKYPTGREAALQKPTGTVRACMDLDRQGKVQDTIHIERSSNSMILDAEAKKLLRLGAYPPFPAHAFLGQAIHRLCINLEYSLQ
jgi:protein TonB